MERNEGRGKKEYIQEEKDWYEGMEEQKKGGRDECSEKKEEGKR